LIGLAEPGSGARELVNPFRFDLPVIAVAPSGLDHPGWVETQGSTKPRLGLNSARCSAARWRFTSNV